jgi:hypothetical protein
VDGEDDEDDEDKDENEVDDGDNELSHSSPAAPQCKQELAKGSKFMAARITKRKLADLSSLRVLPSGGGPPAKISRLPLSTHPR